MKTKEVDYDPDEDIGGIQKLVDELWEIKSILMEVTHVVLTTRTRNIIDNYLVDRINDLIDRVEGPEV